MKTKNFIWREIPVLVILLAPIIYLLMVWDKLPNELPIHWNLKGEVDDYGPKYSFALMGAGIYLLFLLLPYIDPRKKNYSLFSNTYYKLRLAIILFISTINTAVISMAIGYEIDMRKLITISILLLFIVIGNYMNTLRPNWFIGIRVPWTLDNENVWKKTHFFAGKLWFWLGLIALVVSFFVPVDYSPYIILLVALILVVIPIVYSYIIFQQEKKNIS